MFEGGKGKTNKKSFYFIICCAVALVVFVTKLNCLIKKNSFILIMSMMEKLKWSNYD